MDTQKYLTNKTQPDDLQEKWTRTRCMVCGFVYEGKDLIIKCPKCGNDDPDKFEEAE